MRVPSKWKTPQKWAFGPNRRYDLNGWPMVSIARPPQSYGGLARRKRRRDWGRVFARLWCLVFGIVGAVPFSVGLLVRTPVVRAWAASETAAELQRELGVVARYHVEVNAWPLSIGLSDVRVEGSDGLGAALEAARIAVRPRPPRARGSWSAAANYRT